MGQSGRSVRPDSSKASMMMTCEPELAASLASSPANGNGWRAAKSNGFTLKSNTDGPVRPLWCALENRRPKRSQGSNPCLSATILSVNRPSFGPKTGLFCPKPVATAGSNRVRGRRRRTMPNGTQRFQEPKALLCRTAVRPPSRGRVSDWIRASDCGPTRLEAVPLTAL